MEEVDSINPSTERDRQAMPVDAEELPRLAFPVVGIGASAGGLESFTDFFKVMPPDSGMAFVLIQHLPPDRESMIAEILSRHTTMKVQQVRDKMEVLADHVYVIRPGHTLTIKDGLLHLGDDVEKPRHTRPVDDFFRSLAEEQRERAICVIMSGMGSNGTAGAQAVKAVGGVCIAQAPESAQFPSMPRHLIDAGYADYVLTPAEMPDVLVGYARHPYAGDRDSASGKLHIEQHHLREILAILRTRTRKDFSGYKKPTVLRRIQRRMGLNRVTDIGQYAKILRQSPTEATGLGDDLLIHVTGFFRDAQAWEALRQQVIVPLVQGRAAREPIRCWVAACSSGEEAYSLAMLLVEECESAGRNLDIKVFATDTAERTLGNARNGVYPGGIEGEIPPERLARFFDRDDAIYRVRQELRERVVFAPQNVLNDPPFSRLDIVTCRNLLIYLEPEVQQRVIALLHFGLRQGGALFLGNSETVPGTAGLFEPINKKARIFRRLGPTQHGMVDFPLPRSVVGAVNNSDDRSRLMVPPPSVAQLTARALLAQHIPAAVTVDRNYRVVYFQGNTKRYLSQPSGEPTQDLIALAAEEIRGAMRNVLQRSMATNAVATLPGGWVTNDQGQRRRVVLTASPLIAAESPDLFVVSFHEREEPEAPAVAGGESGDLTPDARENSENLQRLRDELQSTIEELQASIEEHKTSAEEAMSVNEELQSSNEELETSKEEMQSLNEEMSAVNAQLHAKMEELQNTSGDLRSLLSSTDIAVIFLDAQFRIRRYTPAARNLLKLLESDVGRPISDLAKKFTDPDLLDDAQSVLDRLVPVEREVRGDDGRWYLRRVLAYRAGDDRIEGVVITFVDITDRKRAQELATQAADSAAEDLKAMGSLHAVSNFLVGAKNVEGVLEEILFAAVDLHGAQTGDVQMYDSSSRTMRIVTHRGLSPEYLMAWGKVELDDPAVPYARALRERTTVVLEDVELRRPMNAFCEKWIAAGICSVTCVPLLTRGGELLGVLTVHFHQLHRPDERLLRITELLARQGADTIERMRTEEELARLLRSEQLARRALDDAAQMKDQFLATLSHELRTPLSAILLWSRMLRGAKVSEKEAKEGILAIISSAESQARLIEDLLDTSRIAAGKLRLEIAETDLPELVRSVIDQNEPAAKAKNLRVQSELSPAAGVAIVDPARLRQVIWNLLVNAMKFTPEGGQVKVTLTRTKDDVTISVSDTGVGIEPDFLPHVFDRFRQYEASITYQRGGLGLGLAISKQLVEMHGGTIRAESAGIDRGATFTVNLPLPAVPRHTSGSSVEMRTATTMGDVSLSGLKILLVEDDTETQKVMSLVLRQAGATVTTASSGTEALKAYGQSRPQIVLSDVGLPDFDGYTLLGKIRALELEQKLPEAPAVALTAYARDEDRKKAIDAGFDMHMSKPVDSDKLITVLAALARQK